MHGVANENTIFIKYVNRVVNISKYFMLLHFEILSSFMFCKNNLPHII